MKTGSWLDPIKVAADSEDCHLSANGARQREPGATPQECDSLEWLSAESAIHAFSVSSRFEYREVNRASSAEVSDCVFLGRCPRLQVIAAPLALNACMRK